MTCSPAGLRLFESSVNGKADNLEDMCVCHDIHLPLTLTSGADQTGQLKLAQVMTHYCEALTSLPAAYLF